MPVKTILGRMDFYEYNKMNTGELSLIKKIILMNMGIKKSEFSHYKAGRFTRIKKKNLMLMQLIINNPVIPSEQFIPLKQSRAQKISRHRNTIILRGI